MINKRCYGLKDTATPWTRLCLDINLPPLGAVLTVSQIHTLAHTIRHVFLRYDTWKRKCPPQ